MLTNPSSRRTKIVVAVVLIAIVAIGAYLYAQLQTPQGPSGTAVPNIDTLVEETGAAPGTGGHDPAYEWGPRGNIIHQNVYETLVAYDGPNVDKFIPWLAESWDVSTDGLVYTFHLRQGIKFQDGTPFNAEAVKFSLDRLVLMNAPNSPNYLFAYTATMAIKGGPRYVEAQTTLNYNASEARIYLAQEGVKVLNAYTVQLTLEHPYAAAIGTMAFPATSIVSPSYVIANCPGSAEMQGVTPGIPCDFMLTHAMGTGPFKMVESTHKVRTVLERFDDYWGTPSNTGPAKLKRYIIKFVPELATRELDLYAGTADGIEIHGTNAFDIIDKDSWLNNRELKPLKAGIRVWSAPTIAVTFMYINPRFKPFDNPDFRLALAYLFPYDAYINKVLNGFATPLTGRFLPKGMIGYDPTLPVFEYNPDKARELLLKSGVKGTVQFVTLTGDTNSLQACLLIKDSLESLNPDIKVEIKEYDFATWETLYEQVLTGSGEGAPNRIGAWTMDISDPAPFIGSFVTPGGQGAIFSNFGSNQTIIDMANEAARISDVARRAAIYREIQLEILRKTPYIMISSPMAFYAERDWVLPGDTPVGRGLYNAENGDGDGGVAGGYIAYNVWKADTTKDVNIYIGELHFGMSEAPFAIAVSLQSRVHGPPRF